MAKKYMNVYKCEDVVRIGRGPLSLKKESEERSNGRLNVKMLTNHKSMRGLKGDRCITSEVQHIDMDKGYAVTLNSIYIWKV
jgi:hypothetical protein